MLNTNKMRKWGLYLFILLLPAAGTGDCLSLKNHCNNTFNYDKISSF